LVARSASAGRAWPSNIEEPRAVPTNLPAEDGKASRELVSEDVAGIDEAFEGLLKNSFFTAAIRRGAKRKLEILSQPDMLTASEVAMKLGMSIEAVLAHRSNFDILGLPIGNGDFAYPEWQFEAGTLFPSLQLLTRMFHDDPWAAYRFLFEPLEALGGVQPYVAMRAGRTKAVLLMVQGIQEGGVL
jgi:hypothetical protein